MKASKRLLALVLCLAMVLSLGTIAFAAESAGIDNAELAAAPEQVKWLVDNGYVAGYDDGTLKLDSNITRAQFATILARATGLADADAPTYAGMVNGIFSDVAADAWYAGYVGYCYGKEIIAGYGDGTFKPEADVTGIEAAKMILCAVEGYDQWNYMYTPLWSFNVMTDAEADGLLVGVDADLSAASTREVAFIMLYNALYEPELNGQGLAYVKSYDVNGLYLIQGDGSDDFAYEYTIADGDYTADSFTPANPGALIELFEYTVDTTTTKGVLTPVSIVTLGDEDGEQYFFVKVTEPDGKTVTWYKFDAQKPWEYKSLDGVIIANEYADLYDIVPENAGITVVRLDNGVAIAIAASTDLDAIGMRYEFETTSFQKGVYNLVAGSLVEGKNDVVIAKSEKDYDAGMKGVNAATEQFVNFSNNEVPQIEILKAFIWDDDSIFAGYYAKGDIVPAEVVVKGENGKAIVLKFVDELQKAYNALAVESYKGDDNANSLNWRLFKNEYFAETDSDYYGAIGAYREGFVYKFIDNDGKRGNDIALALKYTGSEGKDNRPDAKPDERLVFGAKTSFAGVEFGGVEGTRDVCLWLDIDGITYVTIADKNYVTPSKQTDFVSEIPTAQMAPKYLVCDNTPIDFLDRGETYVVYYDLLGNSFAADEAGINNYVLVTAVDYFKGNARQYTYTADLVFGDKAEDTFDVAFPSTADLDATHNYLARNGVNNILNAYWVARNGYGFWTTLAAYIEDASEGIDYSLMQPKTGLLRNERAEISYVVFDDQIIKPMQWITILDGFGPAVKPVGPGPEGPGGPPPMDGAIATAEITKQTEIYVVYGDDLVNTVLLKQPEYYVGYQNIPTDIYNKDIHGIYGIVENGAVKVLVIEVNGSELHKYQTVFAFQDGATTRGYATFDAIEEVELDAENASYKAPAYTPAFYYMEDGELFQYLPADDADLLGFVKWWSFNLVQAGQDSFRVNLDLSSTLYPVVLQKLGTNLSIQDLAAAVDARYHGVTTSGFSIIDATENSITSLNAAPVYSVNRVLDRTGAWTGFYEKVKMPDRGPDAYKAGDLLIAVFKDGTASGSVSLLNKSLTAGTVDYYIDLNASCVEAQEYFGYGPIAVDGEIRLGDGTVVETVKGISAPNPSLSGFDAAAVAAYNALAAKVPAGYDIVTRGNAAELDKGKGVYFITVAPHGYKLSLDSNVTFSEKALEAGEYVVMADTADLTAGAVYLFDVTTVDGLGLEIDMTLTDRQFVMLDPAEPYGFRVIGTDGTVLTSAEGPDADAFLKDGGKIIVDLKDAPMQDYVLEIYGAIDLIHE